MKREFKMVGRLALLVASAVLAAGCADSRMHLSDDFGQAVKQDTMAQIANPDAKYSGDPAPGSNGVRVAAAQDRYVNGKVITPEAAHAANVPVSGGGGGGGPQ